MQIINQYIVIIDCKIRILYKCISERYFITDENNLNIVPLMRDEALKLIKQ